ncbi:MAG: baseplate multidomain protein megatron [Phreatobacter sp.]|uniref:baseplate multidomain protein megatron n=2 Tax=Phreatobacter sp. TaxID=1966341 RepID=UPI00403505EF
MAALVLSLAGAALGGSFGAAGVVAGRLAGALAGAVIDRALFGARPPDGPRLKDLDVLSSTEGAPIPRVYGRMRIAGQVIWATKLTEQASGGGKGSPRGRSYSYTANLAVGLCEGPIAGVGRIWADGKELDQAGLTIRVHRGTEDQPADPLIVAKEGAGDTPAYRGLAYVVFENLPLDDFGSRIPQITCEVVRPVGRLEEMIRALVVIPGATEFGYEPAVHSRDFGLGRSAPETRHTTRDGSDFSVAMEEAQALCPNLTSVSLVVAWFGDDLRAGQCTIRPAVERREKEVAGLVWEAAGETRATARLVSEVDGRPAYGGSPSDATVIRAIRDLKARGLKVTLIPFVMMDVPADNDRPDPWSGASGQPPHPWRGRITCSPAPGRPGSPDGSAAAADEIAGFLGTAAASDFTVAGDVVTYAGPEEWRYRRFVLHLAALAQAAGGVDAFLVGSEMVGLTRVRGAAGHPFVDGLADLAGQVRALLPDAILSYAADWTEYGGQARGADLDFPLDPLWAHAEIGAVGIDWYAPLADRRDDSPGSPYDTEALAEGFAAGEGFDWYYASDLDRAAGLRTPITDGLGKLWVHRQKDLVSWWSEEHRPRVGGVETAATAWMPRSKPIWLTELGFPAVDRGANRPSVFPDPKSSESGLPPFSSGDRDDLIQRRALEAVLSRLDPAFGGAAEANPVSPVYGGPMVDPARIALWAFDARPWPAFPRATDVWADGANWETGHWLNGRLGSAPVGDLMQAVMAEYGVSAVDAGTVEGVLDGFSIDRPMSARDALESLARAFGVEAVERGDGLTLLGRPAPPVASLSTDGLVDEDERHPLSVTRGETADLPAELSIAFAETDADFRATAVTSRRIAGGGSRVSGLSLSAAADPGEMTLRGDGLLHRLWAARDKAVFALPPSALRLEPGDAVTVAGAEGPAAFRLAALEGGLMRRAEAESLAPQVRARRPRPDRRAYGGPAGTGRPAVAILALPPLSEAEPVPLAWCAAAADPWRGPFTVWRGGEGLGDEAIGTLERPSLMGRTLTPLGAGRPWLWDRGASLTVELVGGALAGQPEAAVLGGANALALAHPDGGWEVLQFRDAVLLAARTYALSQLIRGQRGTEHLTGPVPPGASVVMLDGPLVPLGSGLDLVGRPFRYRIGSSVLLAADPAVAEVEATADMTALTPFAPVHVRARREAEGIRISWIRRTRLGGDGWDVAEVGLGEAAERYLLTIRAADGAPLRSVETAAPAHLYPAADEAADFGAPQAALRLSIAQVSAVAGPGHALDAVLVL